MVLALTPEMLMLDFSFLAMFDHFTNICLVNNSEKVGITVISVASCG